MVFLGVYLRFFLKSSMPSAIASLSLLRGVLLMAGVSQRL